MGFNGIDPLVIDMATEIENLPIKHADVPYVSLQEGRSCQEKVKDL